MALDTRTKLVLALVGVVMTSLWQPVSSHGRLWTPPARGTMWRRGFSTPPDYQDNEMFCGGLARQISLGYKCGICGDPFDSDRPTEAGGPYATGTIAANYTQGNEIAIQVDLTANHKGWFEFKICDTNDYTVRATQECLDRHVLQLSDGSGTKLDISNYGSAMITIAVMLPQDLNCQFCVLQWHYHAGNNWGTDSDGTSCIGCGFQEEFYGCSDITILPTGSTGGTGGNGWTNGGGSTSGGSRGTTNSPTPWVPAVTTRTPSTRPTTPTTTTTTTQAPATTARRVTTTSPRVTSGSPFNIGPLIYVCRALRAVRNLESWCNTNCNLNFCPATHCACQRVVDPRVNSGLPHGCYTISPFLSWPGMDEWCHANCNNGYCPNNRCFCI